MTCVHWIPQGIRYDDFYGAAHCRGRVRLLKEESKSDYLPDLVRTTRLCRIQAEKRLLLYDSLSKLANISFACWTAMISLLSLICPQVQQLAFTAVCTSVTLAIISAYTSSRDYALRAAQIKKDYTMLQSFLFELDSDKSSIDRGRFVDEVGEKYCDLMANSENHTTLDYYFAKMESGWSCDLPSELNPQEGNGVDENCRTGTSGKIKSFLSMVSQWMLRLWRIGRSVVLKTAVISSPLAIIVLTRWIYEVF